MNQQIIDLTRQLGAAIQADGSYLRFRIAAQQNEEDSELNEQIGALNLLRAKYSAETQKDGKDEAKIEEYSKDFDELYSSIMQNSNMVEYTAAKYDIDRVMKEITDILALCVNGEDPQTCQPHDCGGSCGSCGGCH
jgi:cell fate (sporulation/competence/biofilm development) regulator YlbF (YheA/YmcA/DUF963 family)